MTAESFAPFGRCFSLDVLKSHSGTDAFEDPSSSAPIKSGSDAVPFKGGSGAVPIKSGSGAVPIKSGSGAVPSMRRPDAQVLNIRTELRPQIEHAAPESSSLINQGSSRRISLLPAMDVRAAKADAVLQAYLARQRDFPLICCELERHVQADQIFIAMQEQQSLVIVSSQERPTHEGLRAFVTEKGQSFLIKKAVWHHGLICLAAQALYLVIEGGDYANDCHFCSLDERYTIYQDNHEAGNVVKLPS